MKWYVQFLEQKREWSKENGVELVDGFQEACGSDSIFILDGRNRLQTMIYDATVRAKRLSNVAPHFIGFQIRKGDRISNNSTILYEGVL